MRQLKTQLEWLAQDHTASKQSQDQNHTLDMPLSVNPLPILAEFVLSVELGF